MAHQFVSFAETLQRILLISETYQHDLECDPVIDNVNHPEHYTSGGIECIEAIEAQLTLEGYRGYLRGNCAKYLWRCDNKGHTKQDLEKCGWYLKRLLLTFDV
jgi:hypothetical protein